MNVHKEKTKICTTDGDCDHPHPAPGQASESINPFRVSDQTLQMSAALKLFHVKDSKKYVKLGTVSPQLKIQHVVSGTPPSETKIRVKNRESR